MSVNLEQKFLLEYEQISDEDLVDYIHAGDNDALEFLIHKYKHFVRAKARSYFLIGADRASNLTVILSPAFIFLAFANL